jgi:BirA family biotin operon repressor/biotin-[acetyl-CoA-carboxylase] ligase
VQLDERVRYQLAAETRFRDVRLMDVTDSTNRVLSEAAAAGAAAGVVVVADLQTSGRGRLDRTWEAKAGEGLLVSVLFRPGPDLPRTRWHLLTAAVALAARDACDDVASLRPDIKWPNDLMVDDRKLAGILAEATGSAVVVGMGLNVKGGPPGAACLEAESGRTVDRAQLLVAYLRRLDRLADDWARVADQYRSSCVTVGQTVDVVTPSGTHRGVRAEALDDDGRLVISTPSGSLALSVGDVTHVRPRRPPGNLD